MAKDGGDFIASWAFCIRVIGIGALHQVVLLVFPLLLFWRGTMKILSERCVLVRRSSLRERVFFLKIFIWLCQVLVVACGIQFPDQGSNPGPCIGSLESQPGDHQGSPRIKHFKMKSFDVYLSLTVQFAICLFANIKNENSASKSDKKKFYSTGKCLIAGPRSQSSWVAES